MGVVGSPVGLGNTPGARHSLQVTDADFHCATVALEKSGAKSGATNAQDVVQNPVQLVYAETRQDSTGPPEPLKSQGIRSISGEWEVFAAQKYNGPYRARTCDLFRVKEAR